MTTTAASHSLVYEPRVSPGQQHTDFRDCIWYENHGTPEAIPLYRFVHETNAPGQGQGEKTFFERFNVATERFEQAGHVAWQQNPALNSVTFGINDSIRMTELRRTKKHGSSARHWTWKTTHYKWKLLEASGMECVLAPMFGAGKLVARFTPDTNTLFIESRGEEVIDQVVVLCVVHRFLHLRGEY